MSDETASTLILVGAIFQLIGAIFMLLGGVAVIIVAIIFGGYFDIWMLLGPAYFFIGGIVGLIFSILWLGWRKAPSANKTALIVTGILGLILAGFLPGLLVLIGGAIADGGGA